MEHKQEFDQWALIELMGHQRIAGRVTEAEIGGSKFVRVDVPELAGLGEKNQPLTKFLGPASIYAITPVTEETARGLARAINAAPISIWDARSVVERSEKSKANQLLAGSRDEEREDEETEDEDDRPF